MAIIYYKFWKKLMKQEKKAPEYFLRENSTKNEIVEITDKMVINSGSGNNTSLEKEKQIIKEGNSDPSDHSSLKLKIDDISINTDFNILAKSIVIFLTKR